VVALYPIRDGALKIGVKADAYGPAHRVIFRPFHLILLRTGAMKPHYCLSALPRSTKRTFGLGCFAIQASSAAIIGEFEPQDDL
jgi:hypothetical protein